MENSLKRPWEGTFLGVLNLIGLIIQGILAILILFGSGFVLSAISVSGLGIAGFLAGMGLLLVIPILLLFILNIFITIGVFKGQKWSIIVLMIFTILAVLGALIDFSLFNLLLYGFVLYLEYMCIKHPFYK